ncbi:DUF58 domain-containing protein [Paenactinomyces guangxiensis]|uniref:DUF58 domain-containing protein n=1 Tax=Paenactinomyces guangxiensis TaxID=1490290 RepID=UPI0015EFC906|nr:DUF58 domain-containing protein [Paenactinomyces guangxiensis]
MIKRDASGLLLLTGLTLIWAVMAVRMGGFVSGFLFYTGLIFTILEAIVYFTCFRGLSVSRNISQHRLMAGDHIRVSLTCARHYFFPFTWFTLRDLSDLKDQCSIGEAEFLVPNEKNVKLDYSVYNLQRGRYHFNQLECTGGDLFGLVRRTMTIPQPETVLVYPRVQPITHWNSFAGNPGSQKQTYKRNWQDPSAVTGLRNYQVGDRLQQIHWKASARGQGMKVKEFEHEVSCEYVFVLDQREQAYRGLPPEVFERAVSLLASLTNFTIQHRYFTSMLLTGAHPHYLSAGRNEEHFVRILKALVDVKPNGRQLLQAFSHQSGLQWRKGKKVVLISPGMDAPCYDFLNDLRRKKAEAEFFWIADLSRSSPPLQQKWRTLHLPVWKIDQNSFDMALRGGAWVGSVSS